MMSLLHFDPLMPQQFIDQELAERLVSVHKWTKIIINE